MSKLLQTRDYLVSGELFELHPTDTVGVLKTHPIPVDLKRYYESEDYISHSDASSSLQDKAYQWVKRRNLKSKERLCRRYTNNELSLLDFGAGTGDFCKYLTDKGWVVSGVEPSEKARALARQKGIDLSSEQQELKTNSYSVITLWHVLEHLEDPGKTLEILSGLLPKSDGHLVIALPNFKSYDAKFYGKYWAAYDTPRHLWHFGKHGMKAWCAQQGYQIKTIKPMWYDSFYVSLLSESYRPGKGNKLRALVIGLLSNLKALITGQYSSLIYVLSRK